jgi:hypothetical protein
MLLTDELIQRIQQQNKRGLALCGDAAKTYLPDAAWAEIGGGVACFAGEGSPFTQVSEFGYRTPEAQLDEVEAFFEGRCSNWELTLSPFQATSVAKAIGAAGYVPDHFETLLAQRIESIPAAPDVDIEEFTGDVTEWALTAQRGWMEDDTMPAEVDVIPKVIYAVSAKNYLARVDGEPAAVASLQLVDGFAYLAGACTRIPFRGRGLQKALLARRLQDAGIGDIALMAAVPGSSSHRNAQRSGFAPLYSELVFMRR